MNRGSHYFAPVLKPMDKSSVKIDNNRQKHSLLSNLSYLLGIILFYLFSSLQYIEAIKQLFENKFIWFVQSLTEMTFLFEFNLFLGKSLDAIPHSPFGYGLSHSPYGPHPHHPNGGLAAVPMVSHPNITSN